MLKSKLFWSLISILVITVAIGLRYEFLQPSCVGAQCTDITATRQCVQCRATNENSAIMTGGSSCSTGTGIWSGYSGILAKWDKHDIDGTQCRVLVP